MQWQAFDAGRYLSGGSANLIEGVHLPQGAQIVSIAMDACDSNDAGQVQFSLVRHLGGMNFGLVSISTGMAAEPGCDRFTAALATPATVDNDTYEYWLTGANSPRDSSVTITAIRIDYRLQVSPAPGAATFNDVPTSDPAFQFIEALAASGITVGCGSGNYCPNSPLTRRQMAVFLAKALGLHWPGAAAP